ncbi:TetR/AcrR family transcriptional regulator [Mycobacterium sp. SMC-4]|uniref:TetR/AcrR family transcriptional regulator n=1 Tax=Mycobacterium sp. SMC-4 TaxID=2857059 RepID=UPI003D00AAA0
MQRRSPTSAEGRRPNRRGESTRVQVLEAALALLSTGRQEAVSANLVAREAGVTWGTVQYRFGSVDGLWAAVIEHILDTAGPVVWARPKAKSVSGRVQEFVELFWRALDSPYYVARTTLQSALAASRPELEQDYPKTARALHVVDETMEAQCSRFFADLAVDRSRARRVAAMLPVALRGLHSERKYDPTFDAEEALVGLRDSVTLYLSR